MVKLEQLLPLGQEATIYIDLMTASNSACGVLESLDLLQVLQESDYDMLFLSVSAFRMEESEAEREGALLVNSLEDSS